MQKITLLSLSFCLATSTYCLALAADDQNGTVDYATPYLLNQPYTNPYFHMLTMPRTSEDSPMSQAPERLSNIILRSSVQVVKDLENSLPYTKKGALLGAAYVTGNLVLGAIVSTFAGPAYPDPNPIPITYVYLFFTAGGAQAGLVADALKYAYNNSSAIGGVTKKVATTALDN